MGGARGLAIHERAFLTAIVAVRHKVHCIIWQVIPCQIIQAGGAPKPELRSLCFRATMARKARRRRAPSYGRTGFALPHRSAKDPNPNPNQGHFATKTSGTFLALVKKEETVLAFFFQNARESFGLHILSGLVLQLDGINFLIPLGINVVR